MHRLSTAGVYPLGDLLMARPPESDARQERDSDEDSVLERMRASGFAVRPWHELMAEYQPDFLDAWRDFAGHITAHKELDRKTHEFLIIAINAVVTWPAIEHHMHRAFDAGATIQELIEVCVTAGYLKGPHAWSFGLSALDRVIADRVKSGRPTPRSRAEIA
jgi:alkylhydroperoxidase/carboxymuconolactone decarboxylase family protein YurZ